MKCPICDEEMKQDRDTLDAWCILEDVYNCPNNHYYREYLYGYDREVVGNKEYHIGSYTGEHFNYYKRQQFFSNCHIKILRFLWKLGIK